jgi:release factor glutamine methyltransferase
MPSIQERLAAARHALGAAGIPPEDAALDAEVLIRHALGWDRTALVTRGHESLPAGVEERVSALLARRAAREPVAQIVGQREFWGLDFEVSRDVLVPRPETELIVEEALGEVRHRAAWHRIVDAGTGSGCLAVALAVEFPEARVIATDVSKAALAVARRNAARHHVGDRIEFVNTDLLDGLPSGIDLIVSNPPYVPEMDAHSLPRDVRDYEPPEALFGGPDGLQVIRRLFDTARRHLAADGRLIVEFGFGQEADVPAIAEAAGWRVMRVSRDLQSVPRVAVLWRT